MTNSNEKNSYTRQFIVTADDFGKNQHTNDHILELLKEEKINRVAIMIDRMISQEEIHALKNSGVKLDLHLELPGGREDRHNIFLRIIEFLLNFLSGKGSVKRVEADWQRQIEKFKEMFGFYPHGINSHEYVHFFPPYFKVLCRLNRKYGDRYVRFGSKSVVKKSNSISRILWILHKMNESAYRNDSCHSSDFLMSLDWLNKDVEIFLEREKFKGTIEIVCHPEYENELNLVRKYF